MGDMLILFIQSQELQGLLIVSVMGVILVALAYRFEGIHWRRDLEKQEIRWMKTIAENVMDLILILDETGRIQYITPSITRFLKYSEEEVKGKSILDYVHPGDKKSAIQRFQPGRENYGKVEGRFLHKEGHYVYLSAQIKHLYDEKGKEAGAVVSCQDITERKRTENRLRSLRFKDVLTGLHNRGYFEDQVSKYLGGENYPLSIIVGDIDDLKKINDSFGHLRGDRILGSVGKVLKNNCRKEDLVCRIGGDEFVMLLPKTGEDEVLTVTERIHKDVSALGKHGMDCSISLGTYTVTEPIDDIETILGNADKKMYSSKNQRKKAV